jgi:hypothetical protein
MAGERSTKSRGVLGRHDSGSRAARALALVPILLGLLLAVLQMPRASTPDLLPLPVVRVSALEAAMDRDRARAAHARATPLPYEARDLGGAIRELFTLQAKGAEHEEVFHARQAIDRRIAAALEKGPEDVLALRAVQLDGFLTEVRAFETTGKVSTELEALGGGFITHVRNAGWTRGNHVLLSEAERRAAYKLAWNAAAQLEAHPAFVLSLDETRALYTLYLTRPHPGEADRAQLEAQRRGATTPQECALIEQRERIAAEAWRTDKVRRLVALDPAYPGSYALGVQFYKAGDIRRSQEQFREHIKKSPDGPWSLRARNHLIATMANQDL